MRTQAAVLYEAGTDWRVEEIELDPPRAGELLVRVAAAGLCHSEEHHRVGDIPFAAPMIGGHEGAGYIEASGRGSRWPTRATTSSSPRSELRSVPLVRARPAEPVRRRGRHHDGPADPDGDLPAPDLAGQDLTITCLVGCYARHAVVNEASVIAVDPSFRPEAACLTGCGVAADWGSSVYAGGVRPGDAVAWSASAASARRRCRAPGSPGRGTSSRSTRLSSSGPPRSGSARPRRA